jgi:hypothetical protein
MCVVLSRGTRSIRLRNLPANQSLMLSDTSLLLMSTANVYLETCSLYTWHRMRAHLANLAAGS